MPTSEVAILETQPALVKQSETEIKAMVLLAREFPRNEDLALQKIMRACKRKECADDASYSYPRGNTQVTGPSIQLLRVIVQAWGNTASGYMLMSETKEGALIRAFAWDLESNYRSQRDHFIERKVLRKGNTWEEDVNPRDWREWVGNIGSRLERRVLENVIPKDVIDKAVSVAAQTRLSEIGKDPDEHRKAILEAFTELNVTATDLEIILGHPVGKATPKELDMLRGVYRAIRDGDKNIFDYLPQSKQAQQEVAKAKLENNGKLSPDDDDLGVSEKDLTFTLNDIPLIQGGKLVREYLIDVHGVPDADGPLNKWLDRYEGDVADLVAEATKWAESKK